MQISKNNRVKIIIILIPALIAIMSTFLIRSMLVRTNIMVITDSSGLNYAFIQVVTWAASVSIGLILLFVVRYYVRKNLIL